MVWQLFEAHFKEFPAQARVARLMLRYGLCVRGGEVWCGEIKLTSTGLAAAANVDRRVVTATVDTIQRTTALARVFSHLRATCLLSEAARHMGWGAIEIVPTDAHKPGILSGVSAVIAEYGVSIRQAVVEDPELAEEPRLFIITEGPVPTQALDKLREIGGVARVVIAGQ